MVPSLSPSEEISSVMPLPAFESSSTCTLTFTSCFLSVAIAASLSTGRIPATPSSYAQGGAREKPRGGLVPRGSSVRAGRRGLGLGRLPALAREALDLDGRVLLDVGAELLLQHH